MRTDLNFAIRRCWGQWCFGQGLTNLSGLRLRKPGPCFSRASREDNALGYNQEIGRFLNGLLLAMVLFGVFWTLLFKNSYLVWQALQMLG